MTVVRHDSRPMIMSALLLGSVMAASALPGAPALGQGLSDARVAGAWDLSFEKGNRRCRVNLRPESGVAGHYLIMPVSCRHAFPNLATAAGWTWQNDGHILFRSIAGQTILDFGPSGGPSLTATVGENADLYVLAPAEPALQAALVEEATRPPPAPPPPEPVSKGAPGGGVLVDSSTPATSAKPALPVFPPATPAEVAGNYAVVRIDRDTGCMVTLEQGGAAKAEFKARLAPACRDQGIVIFDPVGWQLSKGQLVLTAKKGHKAALVRRGEKTWATTPAKGVPLVLKRL